MKPLGNNFVYPNILIFSEIVPVWQSKISPLLLSVIHTVRSKFDLKVFMNERLMNTRMSLK